MTTSTQPEFNSPNHKRSFRIHPKASPSFSSLVHRREVEAGANLAHRSSGICGDDKYHDADLLSVTIESQDPNAMDRLTARMDEGESVKRLSNGFWSALVRTRTARNLLEDEGVTRIHSKKASGFLLDRALPEIGLLSTARARNVAEDGAGVLIGIIDSGFDLSHPAFRDGENNLRVEALLDQQIGSREYSNREISAGWASGRSGPGSDSIGHGTHVASIAGGSSFSTFEGVAPGARFLLVRTDLLETDLAAEWIFSKARALGKPCVINMSAGHHWGAHDGTDGEELIHRDMVSSGNIIVAAAGNERNLNFHLRKDFENGEIELVTFDLRRQATAPPKVILSLYHSDADLFDISIISPEGAVCGLPSINASKIYNDRAYEIEIARREYPWSGLYEVEISISFADADPDDGALENWRLSIKCESATVGRLDGWFADAGDAAFRSHPMVADGCTIGIPATGDGCIAVGSYVTKTEWASDRGRISDPVLSTGSSSVFSSAGPTRDGRLKPEVAAPGQYITAALGYRSSVCSRGERALVGDRVLTMEGTSLAAPIVTGVIALMLQKKPSLGLENARRILQETARHDQHTGAENWNPVYGFGKIDVAAALARLS
jgi:subtilisin family serine protease